MRVLSCVARASLNASPFQTDPRNSHNYVGGLADSYSVDWALFAKAGLDVAVCGYGEESPAPTRQALSAGHSTVELVCSSKSTQKVFAKAWEECDGAMAFFAGDLSKDPGFYVPRADALEEQGCSGSTCC